MSLSLQESLAKLVRLSPSKLHHTTQRLRVELGGAEWKLSLCLLATARKRTYRNLGFANISEYAEKALQLSGKKAGCLLGAARALEHLPLLSEAFREGRIGWGKLRAIRGLATPETEQQWLDFALSHHTDQVVRKVSLSPASWKRHQALQASLEGKPVVSESAVVDLLVGSESGPEIWGRAPSGRPVEPDLRVSVIGPEVPAVPSTSAVPAISAGPAQVAEPPETFPRPASPETPIDPAVLLPTPPQTIRLVIELTPDQYALYERAESRIRAQARRHISRAKVLTKMSEAVLNGGTARARAKHQVLIHTDAATGTAWYDTQKGPLPVDASVLDQALEQREPLQVGWESTSELIGQSQSLGEGVASLHFKSEQNLEHRPRDRDPATHSQDSTCAQGARRARKAIPNATLRNLFAQAGHQCQRCGARDALLDVHHRHPVCEGGDHRRESLRVLCLACHSLTHEPDFATKPQWRAAKLFNQQRATERSRQQATERSRQRRAVLSAGKRVNEGDGPAGSRRLDEP